MGTMSHCVLHRVAGCVGIRALTVTVLLLLLGTSSTIAAESRARSGPDDSAEEYLIDFWSTEDGLPSNTISDILQTPDGYLWCSTYDGLVRFDGVRFVRVGPPDPAERYSTRILCLHLDRRGQLWLGTDGAGLMRYDGEKFHVFTERSPGSSINVVRAIAEDAEGNLWLGTRGGLGRWRDGKATWFTETRGFTNAANSVWNLTFDDKSDLWITDWVSLKTFKNNIFETAVRSDAIPLRAVYPGKSGDLWVGMLGRGMRRNSAGEWSDVYEQRQFGNSEVAAFCQTSAGELWLGARKGLYRCRNDSWYQVKGERLESAEIRVIFEDREGSLWVGTGTAGLLRLKRPLVKTFAADDGLGNGPVLGLCEGSDGGLWVGLNDGRIAERKAERFVSWPIANGKSMEAPVKSILRTRDGGLWIGTFGNGLQRFQNNEFTAVRPAVGTFARVDKISSLLEDRQGTVWVGTFYSLYRLAESNVLVQVPVGGREILAQVMALVEGRNGLWAAFDGLGVAHITGKEATWLTRREGLPAHFVRTLHEDQEGALWIGTTAGLSCWRDGVITSWTTAHGLINDTILQILEDKSDLWLGSKAGIMRVAKSDLRAVAEGRKALLDVFACGRGEGMLSVECSGGFHPSAVTTADGKFWFPTTRGLVMVDPAEIQRDPGAEVPPVHIEEVRVNGRVVARPHVSPSLAGSAARSVAAVLPHDTRRLEFVYTAPGLTTPERVRFRHRLHGFDSDWTDAGAARTAVYTKLPPGQYRFQVLASNNSGVWDDEAGSTQAFRILAPFWRTWWFLSLAGIVVASALAGIVRFVSLRHLRRKLERLEEAHAVEKERMRIAQDMHDEIGGKLSRISFLSDIASRNVGACEAGQQIDQVSETARDVMRTVDEIVWAVSPRNDTFESLAHYICRHAEEFFELTPVELELELPSEFPSHRLSAEVRHNLFCAVKEALNNVLKHANASRVRITFTVKANSFEVAITDNGCGFALGALVTAGGNGGHRHDNGDGLLNMRERLTSISGACTVHTEPGEGTRVVFIVPLK
jgi:ligand-binding sensor domain-containing protein/signal transduction histidine kinase